VPALGITGGIATGKSTFSRALCQYLPAELFDADQCAHELLAGDPAVRASVHEAFGPAAFDASGQPNRVWLREAVFADAGRRHTLEQILHPVIRARWTAQASRAGSTGDWFCADIPLLFETGAQAHFSAVIVIACAPETQRARLAQKRRLSTDLAEKIIAAQLDLATKIAQADHLIWNDSSASCLDRQARLLAGALRKRYR